MQKISAKDVCRLKVTLRKNSSATSKELFLAFGIKDASKTTRNLVLENFKKKKSHYNTFSNPKTQIEAFKLGQWIYKNPY